MNMEEFFYVAIPKFKPVYWNIASNEMISHMSGI